MWCEHCDVWIQTGKRQKVFLPRRNVTPDAFSKFLSVNGVSIQLEVGSCIYNPCYVDAYKHAAEQGFQPKWVNDHQRRSAPFHHCIPCHYEETSATLPLWRNQCQLILLVWKYRTVVTIQSWPHLPVWAEILQRKMQWSWTVKSHLQYTCAIGITWSCTTWQTMQNVSFANKVPILNWKLNTILKQSTFRVNDLHTLIEQQIKIFSQTGSTFDYRTLFTESAEVPELTNKSKYLLRQDLQISLVKFYGN